MDDLHDLFTKFKADFPKLNEMHEEMGKEIHEKSGPLPPKVRWLIKVAISGASGHHLALETHIAKARAAGATAEEIQMPSFCLSKPRASRRS